MVSPQTAYPGAPRDLEAAPLSFLLDHGRAGTRGALVTICQVDGGAPRPVGAQMAVLSDGRFEGQISGGCVEPAIAAEVQAVIATGRDAILNFGKGSGMVDIQFPCGGGVAVLVHVSPDLDVLEAALALIEERRTFVLEQQSAPARTAIHADSDAPTGWEETVFRRRFRPRTRLLLVGRGHELETTARAALAAGYEIKGASPDAASLAALGAMGIPATALTVPNQPWDLPVDRFTATVLLFHDHDWESTILARAVAMDGFYVGALGSHRTHRLRCMRLEAMGVSHDQIARIRGPIGLIDHARDPGTLALSVLAEVAAERAQVDAQ